MMDLKQFVHLVIGIAVVMGVIGTIYELLTYGTILQSCCSWPSIASMD